MRAHTGHAHAASTRLLQVLCALIDAVNLRVVLTLQPLRVVGRPLLRLHRAEQAAAAAVAARREGAVMSAQQPYRERASRVQRACAAAPATRVQSSSRATHRLPRFMPPGWRRETSVAAAARRGATRGSRALCVRSPPGDLPRHQARCSRRIRAPRLARPRAAAAIRCAPAEPREVSVYIFCCSGAEPSRRRGVRGPGLRAPPGEGVSEKARPADPQFSYGTRAAWPAGRAFSNAPSPARRCSKASFAALTRPEGVGP
jgi:hypothetical protein